MKPIMHHRIFMLSFLLLLLAGTGCKKALDINQNPNNPSLSQGTPKPSRRSPTSYT